MSKIKTALNISLENFSTKKKLKLGLTNFKNVNGFLAHILFILFISFQTSVSFGQAGTLDNTFATGGKLITSLGNFNDGANSVAIQNDGKIVLGGFKQTSFIASDFALVRFNNEGTLDANFGSGGISTPFVEDYSQGSSLGIQMDGKILLGGFSDKFINLARLNSDGTLDISFGTGGTVITDVTGFYSEKCTSLAIQSDNKILIGGFGKHNSSDEPYFILVRYNTDGSLDTTFGTNGMVIGTKGIGNSMGLQSDGKIVLGGASNLSFAMERYNANGAIDSTFGINGKVITSIGTGSSEANALSIQNDGKIILSGRANNIFNSDFAMIRYNSNGTLDNTFGLGGKVLTSVGIPSPQNFVNSMSIQSNGKILLAGSAKNGSNYSDFALLRYENDGSLDSTFGSGGKVITYMGNLYSTGRSVSIQTDGKIVLAGDNYNGTNTDMSLARFNAESFVGIKEVDAKQMQIKIYPNPLSTSATLKFSEPINNGALKIYNEFGQEVLCISNITNQEIEISSNSLPNGIYFIQIIEHDKVITSDKLIINGN